MTFDCVVFLPVAELYGAEYMHIERVCLKVYVAVGK